MELLDFLFIELLIGLQWLYNWLYLVNSFDSLNMWLSYKHSNPN